MSASIEDSYVVELPSGARVMTVEELDAALDAGLVNAATPLLAPGGAAWTTLGVLAGLDDVAPPPNTMLPPPLPSSAMVPVSPPSLAPVAFGAATLGHGDDEDALGLRSRRRVVKAIGVVFAAAAAVAIVFGIQSAISQSIASSAAQSAIAAQPPPSPPPPAPVTPPVALPPVVAAVPPPKAAAPAAPPAAPAKAKDADKKKGKLPTATKKKK